MAPTSRFRLEFLSLREVKLRGSSGEGFPSAPLQVPEIGAGRNRPRHGMPILRTRLVPSSISRPFTWRASCPRPRTMLDEPKRCGCVRAFGLGGTTDLRSKAWQSWHPDATRGWAMCDCWDQPAALLSEPQLACTDVHEPFTLVYRSTLLRTALRAEPTESVRQSSDCSDPRYLRHSFLYSLMPLRGIAVSPPLSPSVQYYYTCIQNGRGQMPTDIFQCVVGSSMRPTIYLGWSRPIGQ